MSRSVLPVFLSALISVGSIPIAYAAGSEPQLNFKIYSPDASSTSASSATETAPEATTPETMTPAATNDAIIPAIETGAAPASSTPATPVLEPEAAAPATTTPTATPPAADATPEIRTTAPAETPTTSSTAADTTPTASSTPTDAPLRTETPVEAQPAAKSAEADMNATSAASDNTSPTSTTSTSSTDSASGGSETASTDSGDKVATNGKALQGYVRVVPVGTKIPIIMDTAVDSETSQEGDEFTARTAEDLNIDGGVAVPAGSIIKGRIAQMNAPKHMDRSGSVALKFDTVTTPDNRQIPLVANLVAHGGVVHAKRGMKDIAIDSGTVALPILLGLGIGALAGNSKNSTNSSTSGSGSKITKPEAAMIGAGIGLAVGIAILIAKKGKKVDVRPGDEMKIELAEDLRMPMM